MNRKGLAGRRLQSNPFSFSIPGERPAGHHRLHHRPTVQPQLRPRRVRFEECPHGLLPRPDLTETSQRRLFSFSHTGFLLHVCRYMHPRVALRERTWLATYEYPLVRRRTAPRRDISQCPLQHPSRETLPCFHEDPKRPRDPTRHRRRCQDMCPAFSPCGDRRQATRSCHV